MSYYSGGSNSGAVILSEDLSLHQKAKGIIDFAGNVIQPMDAYLTLRGLKTLGLRIKAHLKNVKIMAEKLGEGCKYNEALSILVFKSNEELVKGWTSSN